MKVTIMSKFFALLSTAALLASFSLTASADKPTAKKVDKKEAKFTASCPVAGKPAKKEFSADYKGGKVYFCCPNCPKAFAKDTAKYSAKANHQLVQTKQAKLVACPFSGGELNTATKINVSGVNVCFCCNNCKAKAQKVKGAEQVELIFNDKAFEKGFKVTAAK